MNNDKLSTETAKPSYWAVLPAAVRYDPALPANAKLLYAEISSLTDGRGFCWASNAYFERLYDLSERTIIRLIHALEAAGYIRIEDADGGSATRKIYAGVNPIAETPDKNVSTPDKNVRGAVTKMSPITRKRSRKRTVPPQPPRGRRTSRKCSSASGKPIPAKRTRPRQDGSGIVWNPTASSCRS